jgi:hypothetical protein
VPAQESALVVAARPIAAHKGVSGQRSVYNQVLLAGRKVSQPPSVLHIIPKVVNEVATKREAQVAAPRKVIPVSEAVSVVGPQETVERVVAKVGAIGGAGILAAMKLIGMAVAAGSTLIGVGAGVAAVGIGVAAGMVVAKAVEAVAAASPRLPKLRACLKRGEWGKAFIGLMGGIQTPIQITEDTIDHIFKWSKRLPKRCKSGYIREIADLLQTSEGISLFRDIIIAHHCMPNLPGVKFIKTKSKSSYITSFHYKHTSKINIRWNRLTRKHVGSAQVVIALDSTLPAVAGQPGSQLTFVNAEVPPSLVLAHELGHHLYELVACKSIMDNYVDSHHDVVSGAIVPNTGASVNYDREMSSIFKTNKDGESRLIKHYTQKEYKEILKGIIHTPPTVAEKAFISLWNHGNYSEVVNILPSANILKSGGSNYSDGVMMGEASLNPTCAIHSQIVFSDSAGVAIPNINVSGATLTAESFVCFSHVMPADFWQTLGDLIIEAAGDPGIGAAIVAAVGTNVANSAAVAAAGMAPAVIAAAGGNAVAAANTANAAAAAIDEFKNLVARMLNLIKVNGQPLSTANNNLPNL